MYRRLAGVGVLQTAVRGSSGTDGETVSDNKPVDPITFDDILTNCYRFLGINDPEKVLDMTPRQYYALMRGYNYQVIDSNYDMHKQAWLNNQVKATKSTGTKGKTEPVFGTFRKFFDYERELKRVDQQYNPKPISKMSVERFRQSVAEAERLMNGGERNVND